MRPIPTLALMSFLLSACGGGGAGIVSAPPPPPPPVSSASVTIFSPLPASQEFALVAPDGQTPLRIRYDAARDLYEVSAAGRDWTALRLGDTNLTPHLVFDHAGGHNGLGYLSVASAYTFSKIAWFSAEGDRLVAFGIATPAGGVPASGTGSYQGILRGIVETAEGGRVDEQIRGTIQLTFDFAGGRLDGAVKPDLQGWGYPDRMGTLNFSQTVFAPGSQTFSGRFDTNLPGPNAFSGRFTGPNGQELIGAFAFPIPNGAEPVTYGSGAWIAKRD